MQLEREPGSFLERIVARPDEYETWLQEHPEAPRGSLSKREIQAVVRASFVDVRRCYEDVLLAWPGVAGSVVVRFGIDPSGDVEGTVVVSNSTGVHPLECCIAAIVRRWRFRAPDGGGPVIVTYPFILRTAPPRGGYSR